MAYKEIADFNTTTGPHSILQYVAEVEPIFFPFMLFIIFIIASLGSYLAQKEMTGRGNMKASLAAAGFITTCVAYVLSLMPGVIDRYTVVICLIVTILMALLLFLPKSR